MQRIEAAVESSWVTNWKKGEILYLWIGKAELWQTKHLWLPFSTQTSNMDAVMQSHQLHLQKVHSLYCIDYVACSLL